VESEFATEDRHPIVKRYIALEGGDGSGKSTVIESLELRLSDLGHDVLLVREPGSTELGEAIREILLQGAAMTPWAEAFLFAAQRAQLAEEVVRPALEAGKWVLSDRTYYSSIAYQGGARNLGLEVVRKVNESGLGEIVPDLVFVLDVPVDVALDRQHGPDRIGGEELDFHQAVRDTYGVLAADEPDRVFLLDNTMPVESVVNRIMAHLS